MNRMTWVLSLALIAVSCGDAFTGEVVVADPNHVTADTVADSAAPELEDPWAIVGEPADDVEVGEPIATADPVVATDVCIENDDCPEDTAPPEEATEPTSVPDVDPYAPGGKLITTKYAPLRKAADKDAARVAIHSGQGVHSDGHPVGMIPPGQEVTVLDEPKTNGYYRVRYQGSDGWLHGNKLQPWDRTIHPVEFARQSAVRNAFFMHQIRRSAWNKDGPLSSGNCAPTSLAMAAKIFGMGAKGKTIEQSIHAARNSYGASSNENDGTSRSEIVRGATKLGFDVKELGTNLSVADELDRIDKQLGLNRAIVLEGRPGSAYRSRMTSAFRDAGSSRSYTFAGNHSILVVSRFDSGKYLVADPISEAGMVTMSRAELKSFISAWGGTGTAVYDRDWNQ